MLDSGDLCASCGQNQMPPWGETSDARACQACQKVEYRYCECFVITFKGSSNICIYCNKGVK